MFGLNCNKPRVTRHVDLVNSTAGKHGTKLTGGAVVVHNIVLGKARCKLPVPFRQYQEWHLERCVTVA